VLQRPTFCNIPAFVLKMAPGGLGREALLASERVVPARLQKLGYEFKFTDLESTLRFEIHRLRTSGK
jgi:NAD dependent epimerase/dehydratase family enzyme